MRMSSDTYHGPPLERLEKGDVERATLKWVQDHRTDANPNPGLPYLVISTLERMSRMGTITEDMKKAGERFAGDFAEAQFESLRAADLARIPGTWDRDSGHMTARVIDARNRLHKVFAVLGGLESIGGSICWHVLGCGESIRHWTKQRGMQQSYGPGALIMSLSLLVGHYRYGRSP